VNPPTRILVIDDDPGVREYLEAVVSRWGYSVSAVAAAEQAFHQLDEIPPDLILLDLLLPGMNGVEALHRFKRRLPDVPVVMVSGYGPAREIAECMHGGASDFLRKPFDEDRLRLALQSALEGREPT
jgi:two-component system response regulator PilR (NtrC family)